MNDTTTEPDLVGTQALATASGLSLRQIDHWTRTGRLHVTPRPPGQRNGYPRHYPAGEVHVAQTASRLLSAGFTVDAALTVARAFQTGTTVNLPAGFWLADLTVEQVGEA